MDEAQAPPGRDERLLQIGELCEQVGLSQRTVCYYEEIGLVVPVARTRGGFRLYTDEHVRRFGVIKQMKPLGFSLEDMAAVLHALERAALLPADRPDTAALLDSLQMHGEAVAVRRASLEEQVHAADRLAAAIAEAVSRVSAGSEQQVGGAR